MSNLGQLNTSLNTFNSLNTLNTNLNLPNFNLAPNLLNPLALFPPNIVPITPNVVPIPSFDPNSLKQLNESLSTPLSNPNPLINLNLGQNVQPTSQIDLQNQLSNLLQQLNNQKK
eukprot:TRINITY_DN8670_c0_g1_i2.p1 TRINITY_DN8670_c0_g1~~TRINITY_DN8670_c0_g1_i2.p1  ORF type:complete len:115 (+),score=64.73 TRINITY_DN8670_c0_g1_i2:335-679(+)